MRTTCTYPLASPEIFKEKLLAWAQQFESVLWLDSNNFPSSRYEAILAVDEFTAIKTDVVDGFEKLETYQQTTNDWIFGYLAYDLKNDVERLVSKNHDDLHFPDLYFFQPKKLFLLKNGQLEMLYLRLVDDEMERDFDEVKNMRPQKELQPEPLELQPRISKKDFLNRIKAMQKHIHRGDIYEANFCQEFFAEGAVVNPLQTYKKLNTISRPPFAAFFKAENHYAFSASPERYMQKTGTRVISQPIKGTARRSKNKEEDERLKKRLSADPKEISENVMIVDLVRNDLSRIAQKGSVKVEDRCKLVSYPQVHQLVSTVACRAKEAVSSVDILKNTFPMGSMTGAPKIAAMEIIESLEETKRGLYSGAIGYFNPHGDFDFNVMIRSILYNAAEQYISCSVGSAITAQSVPENEYAECLVKVAALRKVLEN